MPLDPTRNMHFYVYLHESLNQLSIISSIFEDEIVMNTGGQEKCATVYKVAVRHGGCYRVYIAVNLSFDLFLLLYM